MSSTSVEVPLTQGKVALISSEDADRILRHKWYAACSYNDLWYARRRDGNKHIAMHRFVLNAPPGTQIDHIDDNGLNNTRENLRFCTHSENRHNGREPKNQVGFRGVQLTHCKMNPFRARILVNSRVIHLGSYPTPADAARAYDAAALEHFGEFARLNFPR